VLARMRARYSGMSEFQRNLPNLPLQDPDTMETIYLSPNEQVREVEHMTNIGKKIIVAEINKISQLQT